MEVIFVPNYVYEQEQHTNIIKEIANSEFAKVSSVSKRDIITMNNINYYIRRCLLHKEAYTVNKNIQEVLEFYNHLDDDDCYDLIQKEDCLLIIIKDGFTALLNRAEARNELVEEIILKLLPYYNDEDYFDDATSFIRSFWLA